MTKRKTFWVAPLALGIALGSPQFTSILQGQSQSPPPSEQGSQKTQTLIGKIVKTKTGKFALLTDEQAGKGVYLDDQEKVKEFEGKTVKVTGTLDVASNTVHVTGIEPA
jgi:Protein of unknown function (DUF5818)